jgi:hypothetical protein
MRASFLAFVVVLGCSRAQSPDGTDAASAARSTAGPIGSGNEAAPEGAKLDVEAIARSGVLVVKPVDARGAALTRAVVRLDGTDRCHGTPCRLSDVTAGEHVLVIADPPSSATREFTIRDGDTLVVAAVPEPPMASLRVDLPSRETLPLEPDHALTIEMDLDGRRVGDLPACLAGLSPGTHWVSLTEVSAKRRQALLQRDGIYLAADQTTLLRAPVEESGGWTTSSVDAGSPTACGALGASDLLYAMSRLRAMLKRQCAGRVPSAAADHDVRLGVSLTVRPAGDVIGVAIELPQPSYGDLVECVIEQALHWKFPRGNGYSPVAVGISFESSASGSRRSGGAAVR